MRHAQRALASVRSGFALQLRRKPMSNTPSANGTNGDGKAHDQRGHVAKRNPGGPSNPFGRKVASLRAALVAAVTPQDVQEVMAAMAVQAKKGNVAAARLYLAYSAGKPTEAPNPDQVDAEEWQLRQQNVARPEEIQHTFHDMPVQLANQVAASALPAIADGMAGKLLEMLKAPSADAAVAAAPAAPNASPAAAGTGERATATPSAIGSNGAPAPQPLPASVAPSPSGSSDWPAPAGRHQAAQASAPGASQSINRNPLQTAMARR
jgi:hypothetical protein